MSKTRLALGAGDPSTSKGEQAESNQDQADESAADQVRSRRLQLFGLHRFARYP